MTAQKATDDGQMPAEPPNAILAVVNLYARQFAAGIISLDEMWTRIECDCESIRSPERRNEDD